MVIQLCAPTSKAEEAEVEWFHEDLQDLLELTPKKDVFFITTHSYSSHKLKLCLILSFFSLLTSSHCSSILNISQLQPNLSLSTLTTSLSHSVPIPLLLPS